MQTSFFRKTPRRRGFETRRYPIFGYRLAPWLLAVPFFLLPFSSSAIAQELKKIRLGYPSLAFTQSHIWVAKEEGLYKKYGVDVDPVFLRGDQVATQALE